MYLGLGYRLRDTLRRGPRRYGFNEDPSLRKVIVHVSRIPNVAEPRELCHGQVHGSTWSHSTVPPPGDKTPRI